MKKNWLGKTLLVILAVGILAVGGFAAYRVGYLQGVQAATSADFSSMWAAHMRGMPDVGEMPFANFQRGERGSAWMMQDNSRLPYSHMDGASRMPFGGHASFGGRGFFLPSIFHILFWGVLIWLGYKLFTRSGKSNGWHLSFTREPATPAVDEISSEEA